MGIVVACRCGQGFEADLDLAGKVVQCPACRSPIAVPTPGTELPTQAYVPRPRPGVTREAREANESITTILVAGGVLLVAIVFVSTAIVWYLRGSPLAGMKSPSLPSLSQNAATQPVDKNGAQPAQPLVAGPVPTPSPRLDSAALVPAPGGLPDGWGFFEHSAGRFSAMLPGAPENRESSVESLSGTQTAFVLAIAQDEHLYEATREYRSFTIERGQEASAYDAFLKRRAAEMQEGKVEASHNALVDGRLMCDAILRGKVEGTEFRKYVRLIANGDSILELSCRVPPGKERPAEIKLFLGNYKLQ